MSRILGPLISTADPAPHADLLQRVFGMREVDRVAVPAEATAALFGVPGSCEIVLLRTPGVQAGAGLVTFSVPGPVIRTPEARIHRDAFRVVDFYVPDFEAALAHAADAGYPLHPKEAAYETGDGGFREAHHLGPEGVVTAFLHGDADFFTDFAEVRDRVVSEPISISLPLSDAGPTVAWYREVFGWDVVYSYDFVDPSFSELMESTDEFRVRSVTIGPSRRQTYVNIVDYGLPAGVGGSLAGRAVAPGRGLLGVLVLTDDLDAVLQRADTDSRPVVTLAVAEAAGGALRAATLSAPFGSPHLVLEYPGCASEG